MALVFFVNSCSGLIESKSCKLLIFVIALAVLICISVNVLPQTNDAVVDVNHIADLSELTSVGKQATPYHHLGHDNSFQQAAQSMDDTTVESYCNSPELINAGNEGKLPTGFSLKTVNVFTGHGDRTSLYNIPGYNPPNISCHFESWYTGNDVEFQKFPSRMRMHELEHIRLSVDKQFYKMPLMPNSENCSRGDLTSLGCLQLLNMGRILRNAYWNLLDLDSSSAKDQIVVQSTNKLRTYQSAIALLYGFVPNFNVSAIFIQSSKSLYFCKMKASSSSGCFCKRALKLMISIISKTGDSNVNLSSLFSKLKDVFNVDISKLPKLRLATDALVPEVCNGLSSPIKRNLIAELWTTMVRENKESFNSEKQEHKKYSSIIMMPVLTEIVKRIENLKQNQTSSKIWIYSGHDVTLTALLDVLGLYDGTLPPLASRVVMEIFENEAESLTDRFYLKLFYNGHDKTDHLVFCTNKIYLGLCNVKYLENFVSQKLIKKGMVLLIMATLAKYDSSSVSGRCSFM